jgi:hypothetical protein
MTPITKGVSLLVRYGSDGSSGLIVMPRESGASSSPCASVKLCCAQIAVPWLLDRPVKPGDDGNGIQALEIEHWHYPRREFRIVMALRPLASQSKG